jgi:hypothetical protein
MSANKQDAGGEVTNPDNVGGLPELPEPVIEVRYHTTANAEHVIREDVSADAYYTADQMRAYGELSRAAPAGGDDVDTLLALVPRPAMSHHKMDDAEEREIKRVNRFRDRVIENIKAHCASRPDSAPAGSGEVTLDGRAEMLARDFHETYERLAPSFGYETRKETRQFDPSTPNGCLMIAVCSALLRKLQQGAE